MNSENSNDFDHCYWMKRAIAQAKKAADMGEVPVGAVLVVNNELIAEGYNQPISDHDPTAHAEIIVLRKAAKNLGNYRLPDSVLYVTLEPCTMCYGALVHSRVDAVVYGAKEPKAGVIESNLQLNSSEIYNHNIEFISGILEQECSALIQDFFKRRR